MNQAQEGDDVILQAADELAEVLEPREQSLNLSSRTWRWKGRPSGDLTVRFLRFGAINSVPVAPSSCVMAALKYASSPMSRSGTSSTQRASRVLPKSRTSAGEALATSTAVGRQWRSATALSVEPLSRVVGPSQSPSFRPHNGSVEALDQVELPSRRSRGSSWKIFSNTPLRTRSWNLR